MSFWEWVAAIIIVLLLIIGLFLSSIYIVAVACIGLFLLVGFWVLRYFDSIAISVPCRLRTRRIVRDDCVGTCTTSGENCFATAWRPYGPTWLGLDPQPSACACSASAPAGPGGGGSNGGSSEND